MKASEAAGAAAACGGGGGGSPTAAEGRSRPRRAGGLSNAQWGEPAGGGRGGREAPHRSGRHDGLRASGVQNRGRGRGPGREACGEAPAEAGEGQGVRPSPCRSLPVTPSWIGPAPANGRQGGDARPTGPVVDLAYLGAGSGGRWNASASLRLAGLSLHFLRSPAPLCDSGSAAAPPETTRPQPISARLLTSMRLALARAVAVATLKARRPSFSPAPP